jgi:hypothetical protein
VNHTRHPCAYPAKEQRDGTERTYVKEERSAYVMSALICGLNVREYSTYATMLDCVGEKLVKEE